MSTVSFMDIWQPTVIWANDSKITVDEQLSGEKGP